MPNVTVAFDEQVGGWTSEFSFVPDSGLSLNNKFYTFHNGQIWRHNQVNLPRNNFYGLQEETLIQFVFNQNPTTVKNFKTIGYEGEGEWGTDVETNLENGAITRYILKEGKRYSWIEGKDANKFQNIDVASNAVQGIGNIVGVLGNNQYRFDRLPPFLSATQGGSSVGDALYIIEQNAATNIPRFVGVVAEINGNDITVDQAGVPSEAPTPHVPANGDFALYVKDNREEKSGVIGYYGMVTMTNSDTGKAEIFAVNSESFIQTI